MSQAAPRPYGLKPAETRTHNSLQAATFAAISVFAKSLQIFEFARPALADGHDAIHFQFTASLTAQTAGEAVAFHHEKSPVFGNRDSHSGYFTSRAAQRADLRLARPPASRAQSQ